MVCSWNDTDLPFALHLFHRLAIEPLYLGIISTNDKERWCAHLP
jgi:hypothetical protein